MVGVVLALILRGIFIAVGAALIESFSAIFYVFGAFLLYTAWHQAFRSHDDEEESEEEVSQETLDMGLFTACKDN